MTDTGGTELLEREPSLALLADCAAEARRATGAWSSSAGRPERTFGPPRQTYVVGPYTIMTWHANLLTRLGGHRG